MAASESSVLLAAFRERLLNDRLGGAERSLAFYQGLFPGFERVIETEYRRLQQLASGESSGEPAAVADPPEVRPVGPFLVRGELGRGGQGVVYLATDTRLGRAVALKVLSRRVFDSSQQLQRFHREAALAARLHHPAIATVYEAGSTDAEVFVAMEYVPGRSLREVIQAGRASSLSPAEILSRVRAFAEVVRAVHEAHEAGVLHRDLKPSNLICTEQGRLKVLDFGLARDLTEDGEVTRTGDVLGSPAYMSPEHIEGRPLDPRSDVFALGVTLHEWLTGERPFRGATRQALFHAILRETPPDPRRRCPRLPRDLAVVLATAMAKDRNDRYQSALEFARDLEAVVEGRAVAVVPLRPWQRLARWARREPRQAGLVAALVLAVVTAAGLGGFFVARKGVWTEGERVLEERETQELLASAFGTQSTSRDVAALEELGRVLREQPGLTLARLYLAIDALKIGRIEEARRWVDHEPSSPDEAAAYARVRAAAAEDAETPLPDRSVGPLEQFTAGLLALLDCDRLARAGQSHASRLEDALEHLENAIFLTPAPVLVFHQQYARAVAYLAATEFERAADLGARVATGLAGIWPESPTALWWAGLVVFYSDRARSAELHQACVALDPGFADAWACLAQTAAHAGDFEKALAYYERFAELIAQRSDPPAWEAHYPLGWVFLLTGRPDLAELPLRRAVEESPPEPEPYFLLAQVEKRNRRLEEARRLLERARDARGNEFRGTIHASVLGTATDAAISKDLREVLRQLGDREGLYAEFDAYLAAHPEDAAVALEYGRLLLREGHGEEAWLVVDTALEHAAEAADPAVVQALIQLQSGIDDG